MDFRPDLGAPAEIARSKGWAGYLLVVTRAAAEAARGAFESQGPHPYSDLPEHYVDEIEPSVRFERGRLIGRVDANASYSWWIEIGTSDTTAFAPLRHGADMVGLDLTLSSRAKKGHR
jgi:hypothetical protein